MECEKAFMKNKIFRISQYVQKHPILQESEEYKGRYICTLEYFVRKYSPNDIYALSVLNLYKNKLLDEPQNYIYKDESLQKISKGVIALKVRKFKFFSYRYCLLIDVIFISAFIDLKKAERIYKEILEIYAKRYHKKLELLFHVVVGMTQDCIPLDKTDYLIECVKRNREYLKMEKRNILVTANMSAGKSTLLNALIGKKLNKTQNDACTAKTHFLFNKAYEDSLSYEYDFALELDATGEILMEDNESNSQDEIMAATRFRTLEEVDNPICFIDTPGVNSSQDRDHREISERTIRETEFDLLMYVMNGENIGTDDDRKHLEFVAEHYKGKTVFVINKLDRFRKEDSVEETILQVKKDLMDVGYESPIICPVSAYAAYLAKMSLFEEELNEEEQDELEMFYRKLSKEKYQFNRYYTGACQGLKVTADKNQQLLLHSGILALEKILYGER